MPSIVELLEKAKFKSKPINKHEGQKLDVYKYEVGFVDRDDNNKKYAVDITVKENLNGKFYYDHNLTNIKTLGVPRNSDVKTSTTSVYNESSENNSESQGNFSFADNNIHERKRKYAQKLAKELYSRIGKGWDASNPLKPTEYVIY
jgi:hypothetical protein